MGNSYWEKTVRLVKRLIDSWWVFMLSAAWLSVYASLHVWPATQWLEVASVEVAPATPWESVPMAVGRRVKRPFYGVWTVSISRFGEHGWVAFCNASGARQYRVDAKLPQQLTLEWWTEGACPVLPEGRYVVDTTWRIRPEWTIFPEKTLVVRSNIFEVRP